jgi:NAD(P)-dependent dehydrogenase (short-subunit alcohol dehydrogenase family)
VGIQADLTEWGSSRHIIDKIAEDQGRLDAVVNIAGGTKAHQWRPLETSPNEDIGDVFDFNLAYVFRICREAATLMMAHGRPGSIVNTASVNAGLSAPNHAFYGASKSALIALTRTMATEWGSKGIRANTVSPGPVMTARLRERMPEGGDIDLTRFTSTGDVANVMLFLISDLAAGISGRDIVVDRGLTAGFSA